MGIAADIYLSGNTSSVKWFCTRYFVVKEGRNLLLTCIKLATKGLMQDELTLWLSVKETKL